jgi:hypothetical protein
MHAPALLSPSIVVLALFSPAPLRAEINDSTAHWSATAELSYTDVSGNKTLSLLSSGVGFRRTGGRIFELAALAGMRYGKSNGSVAAENYEAELNTRFRPASWVSPFFYTKGTRDPIRNIDIRVSAAAGAELNLAQPSENRVSLGLAVLEDYERRLLPAGSTDPQSITMTRFNLRVVARPVLRKGLTAEHRTQFEPVASDFGDYLFTSQTSLRVLLTGGLALQTSYQYNFDSTPAPGVTSRSDRSITTGLIVELK